MNPQLLVLTDLKKSFRTPENELLPILDIAHFQLAAGEQVALQGASGCGKTTLLHLIAGLTPADSGQIELAGQQLSSLSEVARDRMRATTLGYIFQTFNLLQGLSALENVELGMLFGGKRDPDYARQLLEAVELGQRMHYRPARLSVGQQQRVAVARALANRPRLVLADEPTANLDRKHALEAVELIQSTCRQNGAALLLVSHDAEVVGRFQRVEKLADLNRVLVS